jgi:hypothetical protein
VTDQWSRATELANRALDRGWKVKINRYYTDILIPDVESGDYVCVAVKVDPKEASKFSLEYAEHNRQRGCLLWPHGSPVPKTWNVIDAG